MSLLPFQFLLLHFVFSCVNSSGVVIKSGIVKNEGETKNENLHDLKLTKGIANFEAEEGFNKEDEKKTVGAQDSASYGEDAENKKSHLDASDFKNENFHQTGGDQKGQLDTKVAHQKGHHRSGFSKTYHKDESGSNSSYFEDGVDEGDKLEHKDYRATYGDTGHQNEGGGRYDNSVVGNDYHRRGQYDNAGRYDKDYGNKRNYNRNNYYDNREDLGRRDEGNAYAGGSRFAEERPVYYRPPLPYYPDDHPIAPPPPPPLPLSHKPHITIYEDPRYVQSDPRYRRSDDYIDDYADIEVRPPLRRNPFAGNYEDRAYY